MKEAKEEPKGGELATLEQSDFAVCRPNSDLAQALQANLATGESFSESTLTRVKTPTGGSTTSWTVPTLEGEYQTDELKGALVYFGMRGVLWPSTEPSKGTLPYLVSHDLVKAHVYGNDMGDLDPDELAKAQIGPDVYDWQKLPYNRWNTGGKGIGKRCVEQRMVCLLPPEEDAVFPYLVIVQPGSLRGVASFFLKLPVPHWQAVIGLALKIATSKGGHEYCQIVPRLVSKLSSEEGKVLHRLYTTTLGKVLCEVELEAEGRPEEEA